MASVSNVGARSRGEHPTYPPNITNLPRNIAGKISKPPGQTSPHAVLTATDTSPGLRRPKTIRGATLTPRPRMAYPGLSQGQIPCRRYSSSAMPHTPGGTLARTQCGSACSGNIRFRTRTSGVKHGFFREPLFLHGFAELPQGVDLDLAHPLPGDADGTPDLFQGCAFVTL